MRFPDAAPANPGCFLAVALLAALLAGCGTRGHPAPEPQAGTGTVTR